MMNVQEESHFVKLFKEIMEKDRAYVSMAMAIKIYHAVHCISNEKSNYYYTKSSIGHVLFGLFFNPKINFELKYRLEKTLVYLNQFFLF